jgi:hypothetical protein
MTTLVGVLERRADGRGCGLSWPWAREKKSEPSCAADDALDLRALWYGDLGVGGDGHETGASRAPL